MVAIFTDPRMLGHVPAARHPERPERLAAVYRHLERTGLAVGCEAREAREATDAELLRVHTPRYLAELDRFEARGGGLIEADTWVRPGSLTAARLAAGASLSAVSFACEAPGSRALSLVRPPGHHARPDGAMGFCLFANVAVAAADAVNRLGMDRVLIVDWDVHHGNGTQEIFDADPRVAFLSIHRCALLSGNRGGLRDRHRPGAGDEAKRPPAVRHASGGIPGGLSLGARCPGRPDAPSIGDRQRGVRRPRGRPGREPRPGDRGFRGDDPRRPRGRSDSRRRSRRQHPGGRIQRRRSWRVASRPTCECWARAKALRLRPETGMTPTGFEPVLQE